MPHAGGGARRAVDVANLMLQKIGVSGVRLAKLTR